MRTNGLYGYLIDVPVCQKNVLAYETKQDEERHVVKTLFRWRGLLKAI